MEEWFDESFRGGPRTLCLALRGNREDVPRVGLVRATPAPAQEGSEVSGLDQAAQARGLAAAMWVSFYTREYTLRACVVDALKELFGIPAGELQGLAEADLQDHLLRRLAAPHAQPVLFVLDGLERLMEAYSDQSLDRQPEEREEQASTARHERRLLAVEGDVFLRKLAESSTHYWSPPGWSRWPSKNCPPKSSDTSL